MKDIYLEFIKNFPLWGILLFFVYAEIIKNRQARKDINAAHNFIRNLNKLTTEHEKHITKIQSKLVTLHGKAGYIELEHENDKS